MRGPGVLRAVLALALAAAGLFWSAAPCLACSCVPSSPGQMLRRADAAFIGRVVNDVMTPTGTTQTFAVEEVYEGELGFTVDVWAQIGTEVVNTCSVLYPRDDRVAVLLFEDQEGRWTAQACAHVTPAELRAVAGTPYEPVATSSPTPAPGIRGDLVGDSEAAEPSAWTVIVLGTALALAAIGLQIAWSARLDRRAPRSEDRTSEDALS